MNKMKRIFSSDLSKGILVLLVTMNLFNLLNLIFHFTMGRMLGPADYGILVALLALIEVYSIPSEVISNVVTKYSAQLKARGEDGKIKYLLSKSMRGAILFSLAFFVLLTIVGVIMAKFLRINFWLIALVNILVFSLLLNPIVKGVLQGRKEFSKLGASFLFEGAIKLISAVILVAIGFKVAGAVGGIILGAFSGLLLTLYFNKEVFKKEGEEVVFEKLKLDWVPYFVVTVTILLVMSMDVILARRFFSEAQAGNYAVLSTLGKMLFLGTIAISKALFPVSASENTLGRKTDRHFIKAVFSVIIIAIGAITFLSLFSEETILILYGADYLSVASLLPLSCIAFTFLALSNLSLIYRLSINKLKFGFWLLIFPTLEIVVLTLFNKGVLEYILALMFFNIAMFIAIGLGSISWKKKEFA